MRPPTDFEMRVYAAARAIPRGRVTTYALLAAKIGCRSPRAVGQALMRNPFAPEVPCHRVVRSDLTPGGFRGARSGRPVAEKVRMLRAEGVVFRNGRLAPASSRAIYDFTGRPNVTRSGGSFTIGE